MGFNAASLRKIWDKFLDNLLGEVGSVKQEEIERALGFDMLREQLWTALDNAEQSADGWFYPINMYIGDDGSSLFSIVTQNGKLYQVGMNVSNSTLTLGDWVEVTEVFEPVQQSSFRVHRQKDGSHRWTGICATSVLNRVAEIDSSELFDSFIQHWQDTGDVPKVDFYHMGESNPKAWDFGQADYLAREGCCYIASGTFDESHPLTKATIRAYENDPEGTWGWSIEFYALAEPEILLVDPKVQVPIYKRGKNTRISVVKEVDAAGLFTRVGISKENTRMKRDIQDKLEELFGDDEAGLAAFLENVDTVNRTIKDEKIIHRKKRNDPKETPASAPDPDDDDDDTENEDPDEGNTDEERDEDDDKVTDRELVLDDEVISQIADKVFEKTKAAMDAIQQSVDKLVTAREEDAKEIVRLKKVGAKVTQRLETVEKGEDDKKQTWAEDLPRKRQTQVTYRPRVERDKSDEDEEEDFETIANETLRKLPSY